MAELDDQIAMTITAATANRPLDAEQLLPMVYEQLRSLAARRLANEPAGLTLQATALVHEAYLRVAGDQPEAAQWDGRGHFFAAAAEAMRRILVERARHYQRRKHGGGKRREAMEIAAEALAFPIDDQRLLDLDEALSVFEGEDPARCQVVKLRYFAGLTIDQTAEVLGHSPATVSRYWEFARAWLSDWILRQSEDARM